MRGVQFPKETILLRWINPNLVNVRKERNIAKEDQAGVEPATARSAVECSTTELLIQAYNSACTKPLIQTGRIKNIVNND